MGMGSMHMGHGEMGGFMSMVMMTQDLPRSPDGLPMEWIEAPFGPLFAGLPGGLALTATLDGDTVARATLTPRTLTRHLAAGWPGPATPFPERLARLDPLTPRTYRILAARALDAAAGLDADEALARQRIGALERERALSHLNWLAGVGSLLGAQWVAARAAALQRALMGAPDHAAIALLRTQAVAFVRGVQRTPLLGPRLRGIGRLASGAIAEAGGPLARAAGQARDARLQDAEYLRLGFAPAVRDGNDALARLQVRLAEVVQSLDLVLAVGAVTAPDRPVPPSAVGRGMATVETPRGPATLRLLLDGGVVRDVTLAVPSTRHAALVPDVAAGQEIADALLGVASLDLSPWEMDQ